MNKSKKNTEIKNDTFQIRSELKLLLFICGFFQIQKLIK